MRIAVAEGLDMEQRAGLLELVDDRLLRFAHTHAGCHDRLPPVDIERRELHEDEVGTGGVCGVGEPESNVQVRHLVDPHDLGCRHLGADRPGQPDRIGQFLGRRRQHPPQRSGARSEM